MPRSKVVSVVGNRPQLVKAAPVHAALGPHVDLVVVDTDQHYDHELNALLYEELGIAPPAHRLGVGSGSHAAMTARILERIEPVLDAERPAAVVVYGDTNTTLAAALAAAKLTIPVVHVESGLRSFDRTMPEEVNRVVVDHLARLLLCPTEVARQNLAAEGLQAGVALTGDVMADAARLFGPLVDRRADVVARHGLERGRFLLATVHRDAKTRQRALGRLVAGLSSID